MNWLLLRLKIASNGIKYAWHDSHVKYGVVLCSIAIIIEGIVRASLLGFLILLTLAIMSICFEVINSSVERLCDLVHSEYNERVKMVKDTFSVVPIISHSVFTIVWIILLCIPNIP